MGYDVHITRREQWFDRTGPEVTLDEWLAVVRDDPEMRLDRFAEAQLSGGEVLRVDDPSMAVWTAYSKHGRDGNMAWMWHSRGNVMAKNPDQEILRKMWQLSQKLSARLQGDEEELYGPDGQVLPETLAARAEPKKRRPWWRIW